MKRLFEKAYHVNHREILSEERFSAANPEKSSTKWSQDCSDSQ